MLTKKELITKLKNLGIKVIGNKVSQKDISRVAAHLAVAVDPSLKPPKKWFNKMFKKMKTEGYDDETARKSVGKIWYDLPVAKKKEIRKREGKHYGPAKAHLSQASTHDVCSANFFKGHLTSQQIKDRIKDADYVKIYNGIATNYKELPSGDKYVEMDDDVVVHAIHGVCTEDLQKLSELHNYKIGEEFTYCAWTTHDGDYEDDDFEDEDED